MTSGRTEWRGKRATVMGLGLFGGGVETARYLAALGMRVTVTDQRPREKLEESLGALAGVDLTLVLGEHRERDFTNTDMVVANPAVAPSNRYLALARGNGVPVLSEIALFLEANPARAVLVTGTQGKSSTANQIHQFLIAGGSRAHLGGNIGRSLLADLPHLRAEDFVVVEISSYQLEALPRPTGLPAAAAVVCTNVLADHLERHGSIEGYAAAKLRLLELADANTQVVLSADDPTTSRWSVPRGVELRFSTRSAGTPARARIAGGRFTLDGEDLGSVADLRLPGDFQRDNVLAALACARALGAPASRLAASIAQLSGLEHRLEDLGRRAGRRVWDNGVSTTPDSTIAAMESLAAPLTLICGGQAKDGLPFEEMVAAARGRVERMIAFGAARESLRAAFAAGSIDARAVETVEQAVAAAYESADARGDLLFSPACASFDQYRNFKDRALAFRAALPPASETAQRPGAVGSAARV